MEYLAVNLLEASIWLLLFYIRKNLRKEMLWMSIFAAPLSLFDLFFVPNYWQPITLLHIPIGIEGVIYSFLTGGIAAVCYEVMFHKVPFKIKRYHKPISLSVLFMIIPLFIILNLLHTPNVMISMYVSLLAGIGLTILLRKDLVKSALLGGLIFGCIYFVLLCAWGTLFPQTHSWFTFKGLPKIFIFNAPIWEIFFGMLFAAYWGNLYELVFGYRFRKA